MNNHNTDFDINVNEKDTYLHIVDCALMCAFKVTPSPLFSKDGYLVEFSNKPSHEVNEYLMKNFPDAKFISNYNRELSITVEYDIHKDKFYSYDLP